MESTASTKGAPLLVEDDADDSVVPGPVTGPGMPDLPAPAEPPAAPPLLVRAVSEGSSTASFEDGDTPAPPSAWSAIPRFVFTYILPVLIKGARRGRLEFRDLPRLERDDEPYVVFADYVAAFGAAPTHLWRATCCLRARKFIYSGFLLAVQEVGLLGAPLVIQQLLTVMETTDTAANPLPAYLWGFALFGAVLAQCLTIHRFWYESAVVGLHHQLATSTAVYTKALQLSTTARASTTRGKLQNHMAVDAGRACDLFLFPSAHWFTWAAAITIGVAMYQLAALLGLAGGIGAASLLILLPTTTYIIRTLKSLTTEVQARRDVRGKLITEALAGIQSLKAYAWIAWMARKVGAARDREALPLRRKQYIAVVGDFIGFTAPLIMLSGTFALYNYLHPAAPLPASDAFAAMSWVSTLQFPLRALPYTITTFVDVGISLGRIRKLFQASNVDVSSMAQWRAHLAAVAPSNRRDASSKPPPSSAAARSPAAAEREPLLATKRGGVTIANPDITPAATAAGSAAAAAAAQPPLDMADWLHTSLLGDAVELSLSQQGLRVPEFGRHEPAPPPVLLPVLAPGAAAITCRDVTYGWAGEGRADGDEDKGAGRTATAAASEAAPAALPPHAVVHNLSLACPRGSVTLVVGPVGAGKSTLLNGLVGEALRLGGSASVAGSVAFATQTPWVLNRTVRENVVFVSPFRPRWYTTVVAACCLDDDIASFPKGDVTLVGDAGITLSGGQKARLALARAVYADADVYILDDVLSALDAIVGARVWQRCIVDLLVRRGKTVLMATHALQYTARREVTAVLVLTHGGTQEASGSFAEMAARCPVMFAGVAPPPPSATVDAPLAAGPGDEPSVPLPEVSTVLVDQAEPYSTGAVRAAHLWAYLRSFGSPLLLASLLGLYIASQALTVVNTWWMSEWVAGTGGNGNGSGGASAAGGNGTQPVDASSYVITYTALNGGLALVTLARMLILTYGALRASTTLHNAAFGAVMHTTARFFATNPAGRVLNRFLSDVSIIDDTVRNSVSSLTMLVFNFVAVVAVIAYTTPLSLIAIVLLSIGYYYLAQQYRISARDMRRMQSVAKSPVLAHFSETLRGLPVIRAFGPAAATAFVGRHITLARQYARAWLSYSAANEFISTWLEAVGSLIVLSAVMLAVYGNTKGSLSAANVGFLVNYILQLPSILMWLVRYTSQVEVDAVSIERVRDYGALQDEEGAMAALGAVAVVPVGSVPLGGPSVGMLELPTTGGGGGGGAAGSMSSLGGAPAALEMEDVWLRYAPTLPWVLRGFSMRVPAGAKVAIVGKTGAGKSSFLQALLRMYGYERGDVRVHGASMGSMTVAAARRRVIALLQDATLFAASVRENLLGPRTPLEAEPDGRRRHWHGLPRGGTRARGVVSDDEVWRVLERVHVADAVRRMPGQLDAQLTELGGNVSAGERAMLCLARALLALAAADATTAIFVADEATASIDHAADAMVHDTILALHTTVLSICHRLRYVPRFDYVVVVDAGTCAEFGTPAALAADPTSRYARLRASAVEDGALGTGGADGGGGGGH